MIDTHAHLGDDATEVLERARAAGVERVVAVATSVADAHDVLAIADREPGVLRVPRRPSARGGGRRPDLDELRALLDQPKVVAVGETGLDYFRDYAPHDAQQRLFEAQLALARRARQAGRRSTRGLPTTTPRRASLRTTAP